MTYRLIGVRGGRGYLTVTLEESCRPDDPLPHTRTVAVFASAGGILPSEAGAILPDETVRALTHAAGEYHACKEALKCLSRRDYSRDGLQNKLRERGVSPSLAEFACEKMVKDGYIREEDRVRTLIVREAAKGRGPLRIAEKMCTLGYPRDLVRSVTDDLVRAGEIDFDANARAYADACRARGIPDEQIPHKLYAAGFPYGDGDST